MMQTVQTHSNIEKLQNFHFPFKSKGRMETNPYDVIRVPEKVGRFEYVRTIGHGSFSVVFLVFDPLNKMHYACKMVSRELLIQEQIFTRFEQEVRILQSLHHPNIVQIVDIIYEKDTISVIMEYCKNGELFQYIAIQGELRENILRNLFYQITSAVAYVHSRGISHRDIKPENILLDENNNPKLADFGLCHTMGKNILLATPCGSPFYAPPEIIQNKPYDGFKSDIWSLGIVFYAMATGSLPWTEISQTALFIQIENADIPIPPGLSPPIQQLLQMMLVKNPELRPSAEELLQMPWLMESDVDITKEYSTSLSKTQSASRLKEKSAAEIATTSFCAASRRKVHIIKPEPRSVNRKSLNLESVIIRKVPTRTTPLQRRSVGLE